jgi:hypothetical protein
MLFFKNFNPIFQQSKIYFIFQFSILLIKDHSPKSSNTSNNLFKFS